METLITFTGKEYEITYCGSIGDSVRGTLYATFNSNDLVGIVNVFSLPAETKVLKYFDGNNKTIEYVGFTSLEEVSFEYETGNVKIRLEKRPVHDE